MTKLPKVYYKVVSTYHNLSILCWKYRIHYIVGQWVYPNLRGTKIFVFDNLEEAKKFAGNIYECEVINPTPGHKYNLFAYGCGINYDRIEQMLKLKLAKKKFTHLKMGFIPKGTVMCDAVKLIKQVG